MKSCASRRSAASCSSNGPPSSRARRSSCSLKSPPLRGVRRDKADGFRLQQLDPLEEVRRITLRHCRLIVRRIAAFLIANHKRRHAYQFPALRGQILELLLGYLLIHRRRRLAREDGTHFILRIDRTGCFALLSPYVRQRGRQQG